MSNRIYANRRILLIGRASRGGAHGYNMVLSERRVRAVRAELVRWGVAPERIKTFWLGWEQPYLTPEVAKLYRVPTYLFDNDEVKLNQSVELVLY
jgi:outer membrane protein OmpA-like peptidoglycan-associated protein